MLTLIHCQCAVWEGYDCHPGFERATAVEARGQSLGKVSLPYTSNHHDCAVSLLGHVATVAEQSMPPRVCRFCTHSSTWCLGYMQSSCYSLLYQLRHQRVKPCSTQHHRVSMPGSIVMAVSACQTLSTAGKHMRSFITECSCRMRPLLQLGSQWAGAAAHVLCGQQQ